MNQKEYELIAGVLSASTDWNKKLRVYRNGAWVANDTYTILCENFANQLQCTYTNFDRTEFFTACGIEDK
jgi:hypothetical protein